MFWRFDRALFPHWMLTTALWVGALGIAIKISLAAADWPQWRGPERNGVSAEMGWVDQWPGDGPRVAWRARVGFGLSSFAVVGDRIFTMGNADEQDTVFCLDTGTGKVVWKHSYPSDLGDKYFDGGTTGTPTVAGDRVFTLSRWGDVFCFELATGKIVWSKNVAKETGARIPDWGLGGSPLVQEKLVVLNVGEGGLALDAATGAVVWQSANKAAGYSTPLPLAGAGDLVLVSSGQAYAAVNRGTGKEAWRLRWLTQYGVNAADPIVDGDRLFLSTGYGKGGALFQLGAGEPEQLWKTKDLRTQMNAAVLFRGHLYGVDGDTTEKAALKCLEFATGTVKWSQPDFGSGGVIVADGRLIALGGSGELLIAPAKPEAFAPSTRVQVVGGKCWTAPVLANGRIWVRNGMGHVVCLDVRKK